MERNRKRRATKIATKRVREKGMREKASIAVTAKYLDNIIFY